MENNIGNEISDYKRLDRLKDHYDKLDNNRNIKKTVGSQETIKVKLDDTKLKYIANSLNYYLWFFASLLIIVYLILYYVYNKNSIYYTIVIIFLIAIILFNLIRSSISYY